MDLKRDWDKIKNTKPPEPKKLNRKQRRAAASQARKAAKGK